MRRRSSRAEGGLAAARLGRDQGRMMGLLRQHLTTNARRNVLFCTAPAVESLTPFVKSHLG
jgi:hypothetical protein